jgi:hypothetical protein
LDDLLTAPTAKQDDPDVQLTSNNVWLVWRSEACGDG